MIDQPIQVSSSARSGQPTPILEANATKQYQDWTSWATLIDRGANGSIAGRDMRVVERTMKTIDLSGIDDHTVKNLSIVTAGGVTKSSLGDIILIVHQAADMTRESKTILSVGQMESFGCKVYDQPFMVSNRTPYIQLPTGHRIPITFRKGLPYIRIRPFTDHDWKTIPHVYLTSPDDWNPAILDSNVPDSWFDQQPRDPNLLRQSIFNEEGILKDNMEDSDDEYFDAQQHTAIDRKGIMAYLTTLIDTELDDPPENESHHDTIACHPVTTRSQTKGTSLSNGDTDGDLSYNNPAKTYETPTFIKPSKRDYTRFACYFPGADLDSIKRTFESTTQLGTRGATTGITLRNRLTSPNPVLNLPRRNEDVATDTLYSQTQAIDNGSTAAQFFVGRKSHFRSIVPCGSTDKYFAKALMDEIRKYGAMDRLISDNARAQLSEQVKDILRSTFCIKDWHSEPHVGNQNFAERAWRDTKTRTNNLLNMSGAPPEIWLLATQYICTIQNHTAVQSLNNRTPIEWLLGYTPDITVLLQFRFWEPVYYAKYDAKFPADTTEALGRFVGIGENVGNAMTFKILTQESKVIHRSVVRSATKPGPFHNKHELMTKPQAHWWKRRSTPKPAEM